MAVVAALSTAGWSAACVMSERAVAGVLLVLPQ
jgi:hypothetical protein